MAMPLESHVVSSVRAGARLGRALAVGLGALAGLAPAPLAAQNGFGDVGAAFPGSSAHVFAGALDMATVEPSSGVFRTSIPIAVPSARGRPQPGLDLYYSSAAGIREAGVGWGLNLPVIEVRGANGGPPSYYRYPSVEKDYSDPFYSDEFRRQYAEQRRTEMARMSHFTFNGEPLVPICEVESATYSCASVDGGAMPDWVWSGWIYFRLEHDSTGARFLWSPDRKTWRVQLRGGEILELGRPTVMTFPDDGDAGIDLDQRFGTLPSTPGTFVMSDSYRWNLVRRFDPAADGGAPVNVVVFRWSKLGETGRGYLTDVYYTPPAETRLDRPPLTTFAHHVRLVWERPVQIRHAYPPIWRATPDHHLIRVDVASKPFADGRAPRELVRRYHLGYDERGHRSFLTRVQMEGRCAEPTLESSERLPATQCSRQPATTLRYSRMQANRLPSPVVAMPGLSLRPGEKKLNLVPLDVNGDSVPDFVEAFPQVTSLAPPDPPQQRRLLVHDGTWYVESHVADSSTFQLSRIGYTVTGDFTSTGETGVWWYLPPKYHPPQSGGGPLTEVLRQGVAGWAWQHVAPSEFDGTDFWSRHPSRIKLIGDINGDGLKDFVNYPDEDGPGYANGTGLWTPSRPSNWKLRAQIGTWRAERKGDGALQWFPGNSCMGPSVQAMEEAWPGGAPAIQLADMNGDSLDDLAVVGRTQVQYWPSDGRGNFTACRGAGCTCTTPTSSAVSNRMLPHDLGGDADGKNVLLADLNGDGYADLVNWDRSQLRVAYNDDGWFFHDPIVIDSIWLGADWPQAFDEDAVGVTVADMNGNGINDLVITTRDRMSSLDLHRIVSTIATFAPDAYASRPDLLIEIDNGYHARTQIAYESTADIARFSKGTPDAWLYPLPQVMHVVQRLTTTTDIPGAKPASTYYSYYDPLWDGWERRLRGFRRVAVRRGDPGVSVVQTYFIPACPDLLCSSTDATFGRLRAASGRPLYSEAFDSNEHYLSSVSYSYDVVDVMRGMDGRWVRASHPYQVDTRLYDPEDWHPVFAGTDQAIRLKGRRETRIIWRGRAPVRSSTDVLLRTTLETDGYGNLVKHVEHGRIRNNGDPIDDPIVTTITMSPPRPDWRFLTERTRTEPFADRSGVPRDLPRTVLYEYDDAGRFAASHAILLGTVALQRHHEDATATVAPPPAQASHDGLALIERHLYDTFDNVIRVERPGAGAISCSARSYDRAFAQLLVEESDFRGGCGEQPLSRRYSWDRGLETVVSARQPSGAVSTSTFDQLGRLREMRLPDPFTGSPSAQPSVTIQHVGGGAAHRVRVERRMAPGQSYVTWSYTDGFGREVLSLRQADPTAGDAGGWIATGLPQVTTSGLVTGLRAPWFYAGNPAAHPLQAPAGPLSKVVLDSFGRAKELYRLDGTLAGRRRHGLLRLDSEDADGRWSSVRVNGLGRVEQQVSRLAGSESNVFVDYLVGGEPARIVQKNLPPGAVDAGGIVRWMQYDSLGRVVLNAEPNTSAGFDRDPAAAAGLKAWRYAYDWSGKMVGASDARGCGWNVHYDRLGRIVARDLSPCLRSQAPYTPPNLSTGDGTEVFNLYDSPEPGAPAPFDAAPFMAGQLVSTADRGAHTRFAYDARGRVVSVARRLARPADAAGAWPGGSALADRYTSDWFQSTAGYDEGDRTIRASTGAISPELMDGSGNSEIVYGYSARGLPVSVGGSYGTLVASMTFDAFDRPLSQRLGDVAGTLLTTTYAPGGQLAAFKATRTAPALWTSAGGGYTPPGPADPPSTQTVLEDLSFQVDPADQITKITDLRAPGLWPAGAKPVSRAYQNDRLGRLTRVDYQYAGGVDIATPVAEPGAIPRAAAANRPAFQAFAFDAFGSTRASADDAAAVFDRSIGDVTRGPYAKGPNQLVAAAGGQVQAIHDAAGSIVEVTVERATCADSAGRCTHRLAYDWDEMGQLARARRWDYTARPESEPSYPSLPATPPVSDVRFRYDASGVRVLSSSQGSGGQAVHAAWPLALLSLHGATYDEDSATYARTAETEEIVLPGLARIASRPGLPGSGSRHTLLSVRDHLGSTTSTIDKDTSELVERVSYLAYGGVESEYRPPRWAGLNSRERFSGKEQDADVGLLYFGARYYFPALGQWISPDPLTIHGLAAGLDPYSYVSGRVTRLVDPNGTQPCIGMEWYGACATGGGGSNGSTQVGFGQPSPGGGGGGSGSSPSPTPPIARPPANSGWNAAPASIPLWQALSNKAYWSNTVDPSVVEGFNAGVDKNKAIWVPTVVTSAVSMGVIGGYGILEGGATAIAAAAPALRSFGAAVFVNSARVAAWFNELSLAEQGITIGGGSGTAVALSRFERASQIKDLAAAEAPFLGKSTIFVGDLARRNGVTIRAIATNRADMLQWLQNNLVLKEGEYLVPYVRGSAHAEMVGAHWGLRNGFTSGAFATSTPGCTTCIRDMTFIYNMLKGAGFTHDNAAFGIVEILLNPTFF
jgi:RHS repeat-associated protein